MDIIKIAYIGTKWSFDLYIKDGVRSRTVQFFHLDIDIPISRQTERLSGFRLNGYVIDKSINEVADFIQFCEFRMR